MREPREPTVFETRPTDDVAEVVAVLWVNESFIRADTQIVPGITLNDFLPGVPKDDARVRGFGPYQLVTTAGKQDGYHGYTFAAPKTPRQMEDAPFRSTPTTMEVNWPDWLRNLYGGMVERVLDTDSGTEGANNTANTRTRHEFVDRYELIPGGSLRTEVVIEEFLSPKPWAQLECDAPLPTQVRYFYKGTQLSLVCLHEDVFVPELTSGFVREEAFGTPDSQELPPGQFFPRTNHVGWQIHTLSDTQELTAAGLYKRTRVRILRLPPLPEAIRF